MWWCAVGYSGKGFQFKNAFSTKEWWCVVGYSGHRRRTLAELGKLPQDREGRAREARAASLHLRILSGADASSSPIYNIRGVKQLGLQTKRL